MTIDTKRFNIIEYFPPEQLSTVFLWLSRNDTLECMCVSRQWNQLVPDYTRECFRHLKLNVQQGEYHAYSKLLRRVGSYSNQVVLSNACLCKDAREKILDAIPALCPNIETLQLERCQMDEYLEKYLNKFPRLSHLKFFHSRGIGPVPEFVHSITSCCRQIVSISIHGEAHYGMSISDQSFFRSRRVFNTNLRHLEVSDYYVTIVKLKEVLKWCPNLTSLVVAEEGNPNVDKAILARYCPKIRHLCYRRREPSQGLTGSTTAYDWNDDEDQREDHDDREMNGISLRRLWIYGTHVQHFLDQHRLKHLNLKDDERWGETSQTSICRLIKQNCSTLESLDLSYGTKMLHTILQSLEPVVTLKSLRLSFMYDTVSITQDAVQMDQPTMNMLQQISKLTCNHPTLMSISLDIFTIRLDSPIIYHVANVPYLKEIRITASKIPSSTMEILFEKATSLERITLWASPLTLTETMFIALAKLRLRQLHITSAGMQGTTMNAIGLRHFIDHHAGPLDKMTITGNIIPDDDSQCITYGDQKLGNRFKYDMRLLF